MKGKISILCFALFMICFVPRSLAQRGKSEIAVGYGYYSQYSLINGSPFSASSGVPTITYRYYINKNVTLGMGIGYENIRTDASYLSFVPELTFCYLDTRDDLVRVRLYGGVAYGISILDDLSVHPGAADRSGPKLYGFQGTPFGIRIGRQVAFFTEIGFGYKGLINGGLAIRVPKILRQHRLADK